MVRILRNGLTPVYDGNTEYARYSCNIDGIWRVHNISCLCHHLSPMARQGSEVWFKVLRTAYNGSVLQPVVNVDENTYIYQLAPRNWHHGAGWFCCAFIRIDSSDQQGVLLLGRMIRLYIPMTLAALMFGNDCNSSRDRDDANVVAGRVHEQLRAGNYQAIYNESAPRFKNVGSEAEFITAMQRQHSFEGLLKNATEIAYEAGYDSSVGKIFILVYDVEFERGRTRERLTFTRSISGRMQLWKLDIAPPRGRS